MLGRPEREFQPVEVVAEQPKEGEAPTEGAKPPEAVAEKPVEQPAEQPAEKPAPEQPVAEKKPPILDDFAGAPDIVADPTKAVPVMAGRDAKIKVNFQGEPPKATGSEDRDSLTKGSGPAPVDKGAPQTKAATKGSVTLTIQFAK